jgi:multiple antibiotic resistance protein
LILTTFLSLFSVINPLGTIPIFLGLTANNNEDEIKKISFKVSLYSLLILSVTFFTGHYVLNFFQISIMSLKISGGIIIAISGFSLISGKFASHKGIDKRIKNDAFTKDDPSLTPLAIPMLSGPGSMSYLITLKSKVTDLSQYSSALCAIFFACTAIFLILNFSRYIHKRLGASGLNSLSRTIGFIIIAIGIEYICSGVSIYIKTLSLH